jgi:hypothetical protein
MTDTTVRDQAIRLLGDGTSLDHFTTDAEIKRFAVTQLTGLDYGTAGYYDGAWEVLCKHPRHAEAGRILRDSTSAERRAALADAGRGGSAGARQIMVDHLSSAWRTPKASPARSAAPAPGHTEIAGDTAADARAAYIEGLRNGWRSNGG